MERLKTHVHELDKCLGGGIPEGHIVLLHGPPGSGKTTLSLQYLINGAKHDGQRGLYLTVYENELKLLRNMDTFKFFDMSVFDQKKVEIVDLRYATSKSKSFGKKKQFTFFETLDLFDFLKEKVAETGAKRIVLDSVSGLITFIKSPEEYRDFFFFLSNVIIELGCTAILIGEKNNEIESHTSIEQFMSDGIIRLNQIDKNNVLTKTLEIVKMRGTMHSHDKMRLDIATDGINLLPMILDK